MNGASHRVVLDTNTLLRALVSDGSPAARIIAAARARAFVTLLDRRVLAEYRAVLTDRQLGQRFGVLSKDRVESILDELRFVSDYVRASRTHFDFPRDPKDAKFIEVAIAGRATHIVTSDHDLLDLRRGRSDASRRFRQRLPGIAIVTPTEFVNRHGRELTIP